MNPEECTEPNSAAWPEIRKRLELLHESFWDRSSLTEKEIRKVLKSRAKDLAKVLDTEENADFLETIEFKVATETYAIESCHIREVFPLENLTSIPCTPAFVLGIANLRGEMVSVIDMGKFFDLPERGLGELNKLIVLESATMCFGILADSVTGTRFIPRRDIQPPLPTLTGIHKDYLHGLAPGHTVVLDAQKLLMDESMVVQEEVGK